MHELSLAHNIVDIALEATADSEAAIEAVFVQVGVLSGVVKEALLFSFDIAVSGTRAEGAQLKLEELPLIIYCAHCRCERTLTGVQSLRCEVCNTLSADIRQGKELEVVALELAEEANTMAGVYG